MNAKQRRTYIRARVPDLMRRLVTMKLVGDIEPKPADFYIGMLRRPRLLLHREFVQVSKRVTDYENDAEFKRAKMIYVFTTTP